jgi:hypothetical protein
MTLINGYARGGATTMPRDLCLEQGVGTFDLCAVMFLLGTGIDLLSVRL